ncbi:MAG TPA: VTT domain-containing protein [Chloroflexia bacterium]|nr:VTT domain-containing protein [Chloroflexia bacterium]
MTEIFSPVVAAGGFLDITEILTAFGYAGIVAIIFAESGLLVGFFLPGDSLLFTAGVLASSATGNILDTPNAEPLFNIFLLAGLCFLAAVAGDSVGYWFGQKVGPRIFTKEDSLFFHKDHVYRAQKFYEKHGGKTVILARFLPVVRTFAPIVAGVGRMKYRTFLFFNVIGGFCWAVGVTILGYFLGEQIGDNIDKYLIPLILLIIFISIAPTAWHVLKEKENRAQLALAIRKLANRQQR